MEPQFLMCTDGRVFVFCVVSVLLSFGCASSGFGERLAGVGEVTMSVRTCSCELLVFQIVVQH